MSLLIDWKRAEVENARLEIEIYNAQVEIYKAQAAALAATIPGHSYVHPDMTPEGRIKAKVKKLFEEYGDELYYHMPIQNGMGAPPLDFVCCYRGHYFVVEAKAPDRDLTERQRVTANTIQHAGGTVFRVRDQSDLNTLEMWLESRS